MLKFLARQFISGTEFTDLGSLFSLLFEAILPRMARGEMEGEVRSSHGSTALYVYGDKTDILAVSVRDSNGVQVGAFSIPGWGTYTGKVAATVLGAVEAPPATEAPPKTDLDSRFDTDPRFN